MKFHDISCCVLCDVIHRHLQGSLYVQITTWLHGTRVNVTPFTLIKLRLSRHRISQNSQLMKIIMCRPLTRTEFKPNKMWKTWKDNLSHPQVKYGLHRAEFYETRNNQQIFVHIFHIQFYPNRRESVKNMDKM